VNGPGLVKDRVGTFHLTNVVKGLQPLVTIVRLDGGVPDSRTKIPFLLELVTELLEDNRG
jgi:hypothetical protein